MNKLDALKGNKVVRNQTLFQFTKYNYPNEITWKKIHGSLYMKEADFKVFEISANRICCSDTKQTQPKKITFGDSFVKLTLIKKGISTFAAVRELSQKTGIPENKIKYSGLKDTFGVTSQYIALPTKEFLEKKDVIFKINEQFKLINPKSSSKELKIGKVFGNRFEVTVRNIINKPKEIETSMDLFNRYLKENEIPNYYGHQRFGQNQDNHIIGKNILLRDFESALKIRLTGRLNESNNHKKARESLEKNWRDWETCYNILSKDDEHFKEELAVLAELKKNKNDFLGALRSTNMLYFFIDAYHSYLFNNVLMETNKKGIIVKELPLLGPRTKFTDKRIYQLFNKFLKADGLGIDSYKHNNLAAGIRERMRKTSYGIEKFEYELNKNTLILKFELPMGAYANLILDRIIANNNKHKIN